MGGCMSVSEEEKKNRDIEKQMRRDRRADESLVKLLLLGTGESGKSTLFKQMKILYTEQKGFTKSERAAFVSVVHNNIIFNMQQLLKGCETHTPAENQELAGKVLALDPKTTVIDATVANMLADIWADSGVQDSWFNRSTIQVQDALEYYMGRITEISQPDYSPDNQDILRVRVRTSGIVEENFEINGTKIAMYDVGGQRNERRKWMHKFEDVSAIIYVAAISEYDQLLFEDNTTNRQDESLQLFEKVFNSEFFKHLNFILFLNKEDLFIQKLPVIPFRVVDGPSPRNVDFQGPYCEPGKPSSQIGTPEFDACLKAAEAYIRGLYEAINNRKNPLYVHVTDATNTENMNKIMTAVKDIVLRENLQATGFIVGEDRI